MATLYADENYPLGIVEHLRSFGHDVLTARGAGKTDRGIPDEEVLAFATAQGRAVITHNRKHFFRLHATTAGQHAGIVACTFDPDEARQAARVDECLRAHPNGLHGKVVRVYRPS